MERFYSHPHRAESSLVKQYTALLDTEGVQLEFSSEALEEIARFAFRVNEGTENIGARRLHTIMERVLDEISFEAPEKKGEHVKIDADYVRHALADIVKDQDCPAIFCRTRKAFGRARRAAKAFQLRTAGLKAGPPEDF